MSAWENKAWLSHYEPETPHTLEYSEQTVLDIYNNNLSKNSSSNATWFFGRTQSYWDVDQQVRHAAAGLKAFGIGPGDRVALALPNCPQHLIAFFAILKVGATVVQHNPLYTAHELEGLFNDHGARVAIVWDKSAPTFAEVREHTALESIISVNITEAMPPTKRLLLSLPIPSIKKKREALTGDAPNTISWSTFLSETIGGSGRNIQTPEISSEDIALILYTSGTTGVPKGALLSHGNLVANCMQAKAVMPGLGDEEERFLAALPIFHAYGLTLIMTLGISVGAEIFLLPSPKIPLILDVFKKHTPTMFPAVPTIYQELMREAKKQGIEIHGVRRAISGAATLPVDTVEQWESSTGGLLVEGYGLTEASPILTVNPLSPNRRAGHIGLPVPDTEIRIANPDNLNETMPDGEPGELLARGPQVFQGYLNKEQATADTFHNGWLRTGDMAVMDADGFVRLVSRIKEIIITGGFNVYPAEVEEIMRGHHDVVDCAVVGLDRADGSEDVVACIVLREGAALDPDGLKAYARENLIRYKVPRTFYHFEELAKDQLGKVRRREVKTHLVELLEQNEKEDALVSS